MLILNIHHTNKLYYKSLSWYLARLYVSNKINKVYLDPKNDKYQTKITKLNFDLKIDNNIVVHQLNYN